MGIRKLLLIPFAAPYGLIIRIRHWMFKINILKSVSYDIPIIGVGNLSLGGTGKTPMVEFIIRLLMEENKLAVLSRGYGRSSKGYLIADQYSDHHLIGDEIPCNTITNLEKNLKLLFVKIDGWEL